MIIRAKIKKNSIPGDRWRFYMVQNKFQALHHPFLIQFLRALSSRAFYGFYGKFKDFFGNGFCKTKYCSIIVQLCTYKRTGNKSGSPVPKRNLVDRPFFRTNICLPSSFSLKNYRPSSSKIGRPSCLSPVLLYAHNCITVIPYNL